MLEVVFAKVIVRELDAVKAFLFESLVLYSVRVPMVISTRSVLIATRIRTCKVCAVLWAYMGYPCVCNCTSSVLIDHASHDCVLEVVALV